MYAIILDIDFAHLDMAWPQISNADACNDIGRVLNRTKVQANQTAAHDLTA